MDTLETIDLVKLIADVGLSAVLAIVLLNATRGANAAQLKALEVMTKLTSHISASTKALTDLKDSEDKTTTVVSSFRNEVNGAHIEQLDGIRSIQNVTSLLPGISAAIGRIEPGMVEIRTTVEAARNIAAQMALSLDSALNRMDAAIPNQVSVDAVVEHLEAIAHGKDGNKNMDNGEGI